MDHVTLAGRHLAATWPYHEDPRRDHSWERDYVQYLSLFDVPESELLDYQRYGPWQLHQMTFERAVSLPREVPGSQGRLYWIDLRWYGWNRRAMATVAARDPFFREPLLDFEHTDYLRRQTGNKRPEIGKDGTRPALGIVSYRWLIRDSLETRRSATYYDLTFARQRFPERRYQQGGKWYRQDLPFVDFPKTIDDFESAFGVDKVKQVGKEREISLDFGAIVRGGRDYPGEGSIVTLHNRLIVVHNAIVGGKFMRTYDVLTTTGDRDYSERLFFNGKRFKKGDGADAANDGGEALGYTPNGGLLGFLYDGQGKRIETAVADAANDTSEKRLNQGVRTVGSCHVCHGPSGGFIPPRNAEEITRQAGVTRKFRDRETEQRYHEFLFDWTEGMEGDVRRYHALVARTTAPSYAGVYEQLLQPPQERRSWSGADVAEMTARLRDRYDDPVDATRAARELGMEPDLFRILAGRIGGQKVQRFRELQQGLKVPSETWEVDMLPEMQKYYDYQRGR